MTKSAIEIEKAKGLIGIDPLEWDTLSNELPFQSYQWFMYGEKVLSEAGAQPRYLILRLDGKPIARAALWWISNEPLPVSFLPFRKALEAFQKRWPLLICRSPLANTTGLVLPEPPRRGTCLELIAQSARTELFKGRGSYLLFDFIDRSQIDWPDWPAGFHPITISDPGTQMELRWEDFEGYLAASTKKNRRNYKHIQHLTENSGLELTCKNKVTDLEAALRLIHNVEGKHHSTPNPWFRGMLAYMHLIDSSWLEVHQGQRLVGCLLLLRDKQAQFATAIGLADDVKNVYFQLLYAAQRIAYEKHIKHIHLGSGAYEAKRRMGFELEFNNSVLFYSPNPAFNLIGRLF